MNDFQGRSLFGKYWQGPGLPLVGLPKSNHQPESPEAAIIRRQIHKELKK